MSDEERAFLKALAQAVMDGIPPEQCPNCVEAAERLFPEPDTSLDEFMKEAK